MMLLLDVTIRSSVILLVALAACALLRNRSAALRHSVLAAAIVAAAAVAPLSGVLPAWDFPLPASQAVEAPPDNHVAVTVAVADEPPVGTVADEEPVAGVTSATSPLSLIAIVWAAGFVAAAATLLTGFGRLTWIAARAARVEDGRWARMAQQLSAASGLKRPISILHTDASDLIATWGLLRPRLLLPSHARDWDEGRIHLVLCHELAHIRRRDWLVQISAEAVRTIYWFNPLLWIACARLRHESEQACDDAVLDGGVPAAEYAAHLLEIARRCRRSGPAWASAMPMARPSTLERRIIAMLNPALNRRALSRRALAVTAAMLLGITLPTAAFRAGQNAPLPLIGSVYDASGAVMPGVELTLQDAQEFTWEATTGADGRFEFPPVQPGRYRLEASIPGFHRLRHDFDLQQARDWDRAITLQVGQLTETIHVSVRRPTGARPQAQAPQRIRVGGNIRPPRKLYNVNPVYPASMRDAGREGIVPIEAIIDRDGVVQSARVLSAQVHPDFAMAALEAVQQWRFDATLLNGQPVEVVINVSVHFSLDE